MPSLALRRKSGQLNLRLLPAGDVVAKYCGICHSLDYLTINSPILDRQGRTTEVNKMINVFGAPINPYETRIIIGCLANNYGARGDMRPKRDR